MRTRLLMAAMSAALRTNTALLVDAGLRSFAPTPTSRPVAALTGRYVGGYQRSRHTTAMEKRAALKARNKKRSRK